MCVYFYSSGINFNVGQWKSFDQNMSVFQSKSQANNVSPGVLWEIKFNGVVFTLQKGGSSVQNACRLLARNVTEGKTNQYVFMDMNQLDKCEQQRQAINEFTNKVLNRIEEDKLAKMTALQSDNFFK